jgi:hypothetical protein
MLIASIILTIFVTSCLERAGTSVWFKQLAIIWIGTLGVIAVGDTVLRLVKLSSIRCALLCVIVLGCTFTSLYLTIAVAATGINAGTLLIPWVALFISFRACLAYTAPENPTREELSDLIALVCLAILILFWCRNSISSVATLKSTGLLPVWTDYYIHGSTVAQFGIATAAHRGSILLADQPLLFYHYSTYMLASALMDALHTSGLVAATAFLLPAGLLLAAIGSYALGSTLADRRAAVIAIGALTVLPDPSTYWFSNGYFAFYWMLFTGPGAGYALATASLSLICCIEWTQKCNRRAFAMALTLAVAIFEERVQIFIWFFPALLAILFFHTDWFKKRSRMLLWTTGIGLVCAIVLILSIPTLFQFWGDLTVAPSFLAYVHGSIQPTAYLGLYEVMQSNLGQSAAIIIGTALLIPIVLGFFAFLYPSLVLVHWLRGSFETLDVFPYLVLGSFLACVWCSPTSPAGDYGEFKQRAFVLLYQTTVIWTAALAIRNFPNRSKSPLSGPLLLSLVSLTMISIFVGSVTRFAPESPRTEYGHRFLNVPIEPGLLQSAEYIRGLAIPKDIVAVAPVQREAMLADPATEFTSLSNLPSYIGRPAMVPNRTGERSRVVNHRISQLEEVAATSTYPSAMDKLRRMGVSWYVWIGRSGPTFDRSLTQPDFLSGTVAVYHAGLNMTKP